MVCGLSRMWKTPKIKCLKSYIGFIFFFQSTTLHSLSTDQLYFTFKYKTIQSQHRLAALLKLPFFLMAAAIFFNGSFNKRISSIGMSIFHLTSTDLPNTLLTDEASCLRTAPHAHPPPSFKHQAIKRNSPRKAQERYLQDKVSHLFGQDKRLSIFKSWTREIYGCADAWVDP